MKNSKNLFRLIDIKYFTPNWCKYEMNRMKIRMKIIWIYIDQTKNYWNEFIIERQNYIHIHWLHQCFLFCACKWQLKFIKNTSKNFCIYMNLTKKFTSLSYFSLSISFFYSFFRFCFYKYHFHFHFHFHFA